MHALLLLPQARIGHDSLHLLLHFLHGVRPSSSAFLSYSEAHTTTRTEFEHALIGLEAHARTNDSTVYLRVEVFCVRVLGDELGNLNTSYKVLIGLSHEVVVPRLHMLQSCSRSLLDV